MAVYKRSIFDPPLASAGSGDGASANPQTDPWTGEPNAAYRAPRPSAELTADGQEDRYTGVRLRYNEQAFKQSQNFIEHHSDGIDGGSTGAGMALNWDVDAGDKTRCAPADYAVQRNAAVEEQQQ